MLLLLWQYVTVDTHTRSQAHICSILRDQVPLLPDSVQQYTPSTNLDLQQQL